MHIAINGWFIGRQATGSGQYLHHLLDHLPQQRADIALSVLTPSQTYNPTWHDRWQRTELVPVSLPNLPRNAQKVWWEQITFPRVARRLDPDIFWVPYWAAPYWQPKPVAVTIHDVIPMLLPAYRGGLYHRAYTRLVAHTARKSATVLTVSHASAHDISRQLGIPLERIHVVYHGPNAGSGSLIDRAKLDQVRQRYSLPDGFFLYLGGFDVRKNVESVIQAYKRYLDGGGNAQIGLVLAGALPDRENAVLKDPRKTVAALNLKDHVHFPGWVEENDKPALYALATAFVFPSEYEGFGMMALEAMAAGTSVITSDR